MKNNAEKWGKHLLQVQKMCVSLVAGVICTWAFFRISFFVYFFGFLGYTLYYSITHKSYDLLLVIAIFSVFGAYFFKKAFFPKKEP